MVILNQPFDMDFQSLGFSTIDRFLGLLQSAHGIRERQIQFAGIVLKQTPYFGTIGHANHVESPDCIVKAFESQESALDLKREFMGWILRLLIRKLTDFTHISVDNSRELSPVRGRRWTSLVFDASSCIRTAVRVMGVGVEAERHNSTALSTKEQFVAKTWRTHFDEKSVHYQHRAGIAGENVSKQIPGESQHRIVREASGAETAQGEAKTRIRVGVPNA
jgi:hypothetical protein